MSSALVQKDTYAKCRICCHFVIHGFHHRHFCWVCVAHLFNFLFSIFSSVSYQVMPNVTYVYDLSIRDGPLGFL